MSDIQIFVDDKITREDLLKFLHNIVGVHLRKGEDDFQYGGILLGCHLDLFLQEDFEDDMGIEFSKYKYVVDLTPNLGVLGEDYYSTGIFLASNIALALSRLSKASSIVVDNLQRLIAEYKSAV